MESTRIIEKMKDYKNIIRGNFFSIGSVVAFIWNNDATWSVATVSKNIKSIFGYEDTLFLENKLSYSSLIHPEDLARVFEEVKEASVKKLDSFNHEPYRVKTANGKYLWVKDSTNILYDEAQNITHFVGYIISINDEIKKIAEQKKELQTIFDTTKDGIAVLDLDTNFKKVNKAYCEITGLSEEELLTTSCFAMTYPEDIPNSLEKMKVLFEDGFVDGYEKRCLIGEKIVTIHMSATLLPDGNHMLVSIKDISKMKTFEAQAKMASMGEMIGNIAHQWRQPLSVITATASGIAVKQEFGLLDETTITHSMESIIFQANYLSKTIDDFRNFIKDSDETQIFSIKEILTKTFMIIKPALMENHITLITDLVDDIMLVGYENQLIQAFINIINNAKDAIKENVDNDENKFIFVKTKRVQNKLEILIKDSGGGIHEDVIAKIFEPYFTTKHQSQGTGIGLSMAYKIFTEQHNGTIEVENMWYIYNDKKYKGACFKIVFEEINQK